MSAAISSMHDEPGRDWTVEELAQRAGMSRSTFALRFKKTVGASPAGYNENRMVNAQHLRKANRLKCH
jgi:transcriptional regulator GlxA family with amidase domain